MQKGFNAFRHSFCATLMMATILAHAAPNPAPLAFQGDDLEKLMADRGVLSKVQKITSTVTDQVSSAALAAGDVVVSAMGFIGLPYKRGGNSFETGFDCSGFVKALYEQTLGRVLPRNAAEQAAQTKKIDAADLQPGDLVFFNTMRRAFSHVGIYIGEGRFIHSPKPGAQVRIEDMHTRYWDKRFDGARRVEQ